MDDSMFKLLYLIILVAAYVFGGVVHYKFAQKAGLENEAWKAWVPILQVVLFLHIIDRSGWNILWLFVPIANIVFIVIWYIDFLKRFNQNPIWVVALFIPTLNLIFTGFLVYMAFSQEVQYVSSIY